MIVTVKTESRVLLSALIALPFVAGLLLAIFEPQLLYGWILLALSVGALLYVWWPRKPKPGDHHKGHK
jgi:hypothetical protein